MDTAHFLETDRAARGDKVRRGLLRFLLGLPNSMRSARKANFVPYVSSALRVVKFFASMRSENFAEAAVKSTELALGSSGLEDMQKGAGQKGPRPCLPTGRGRGTGYRYATNALVGEMRPIATKFDPLLGRPTKKGRRAGLPVEEIPVC